MEGEEPGTGRGGRGKEGGQPSMHGPPLTIRGTDSPQSGLSIMSGGKTDVDKDSNQPPAHSEASPSCPAHL